MKPKNESVIVSISFTNDNKVLIVGTQKSGQIDIVNAFDGDDAYELWTKLTTKKINKK